MGLVRDTPPEESFELAPLSGRSCNFLFLYEEASIEYGGGHNASLVVAGLLAAHLASAMGG